MSASLSILKDNVKQVESIFKKMQNNIEKYKNADQSDKKGIERAFDMDKNTIKDIVEAMKIEISSLNNEQKEEEYNGVLKGFKVKLEELFDEFKKVKNDKIHIDDIKIEPKFDLDKANVQQVMDYGDKILDDDEKAIQRMLKKVNEATDVAGNIKVNLQKQKEQLEKTQTNLKEIDYSLDRANKTLKNMLKRYATDKIILGLIVIIVLGIIAIIIVSAVGGNKQGYFNVPNDWFSNNGKVTNSTTTASGTSTSGALLR